MCNHLLGDLDEEAERMRPERTSIDDCLNSEALAADCDDERGPVLLPNGRPLRLEHWTRRIGPPSS
jgi:hypothetical protein